MLDCTELSYLDSTGVVLLQSWNSTHGGATLPVVVTNVQPQIRRVLGTCSVGQLIVE